MPPKIRPRWGCDYKAYTGFPPERAHYHTAAREALSRLGHNWPQEELYALDWAIDDYFLLKEHGKDWPTRAEVRAALKELQGAAERFGNIARQLDRQSQIALALAGTSVEEPLGDTLEHAFMLAEILKKRAAEALKTSAATPRRGRRPEALKLRFLLQLASTYEKATGKRPGYTEDYDSHEFSGPFFDLAGACFTALGDPPHSNQALGNQIKEMLNLLKKRGK